MKNEHGFEPDWRALSFNSQAESAQTSRQHKVRWSMQWFLMQKNLVIIEEKRSVIDLKVYRRGSSA